MCDDCRASPAARILLFCVVPLLLRHVFDVLVDGLDEVHGSVRAARLTASTRRRLHWRHGKSQAIVLGACFDIGRRVISLNMHDAAAEGARAAGPRQEGRDLLGRVGGRTRANEEDFALFEAAWRSWRGRIVGIAEAGARVFRAGRIAEGEPVDLVRSLSEMQHAGERWPQSRLAVLQTTAAGQATHRRQQKTEVRASRAAPFSILEPSLVLDWQKKMLRRRRERLAS